MTPDLLLLHGWGFQPSVWRPLQALFEGACRVTAPSLWPLFGDGDVEAVADSLAESLARPVICCGWSLGGILAAALAARHPEKVAGLVTVACNPCFVARSDWPGMAADTFAGFTAAVGEDPVRALGRFLLLNAEGDRAPRVLGRALKPHLAVDQSAAQLEAGLRLLAGDWRALFGSISVPAVHLLMTADALVPAAIAEVHPVARAVRLMPGGHASLVVQPGVVAEAVRDLLVRGGAKHP